MPQMFPSMMVSYYSLFVMIMVVMFSALYWITLLDYENVDNTFNVTLKSSSLFKW
uniref:ATP synthase F0 subunit 8 n=1 Tax=Amyrsidea minuta TaxID=2364307 RepID=A0A386B2K7_9NEOP|nr:ATP synthase F0 subunit 8 [Amyrsidea minuta]